MALNIEVGLEQVWRWHCPNCGIDQYAENVIAELSEDEQSELALEHGIWDAATGDWVRQPETVTCSSCGNEFPVTQLEVDWDSDSL